MPDDVYTHGHHASVLRSHRSRTVENSAAYLAPHLAAGQRVLDVGCGPGTITAGLARLVHPGPVLGLDRSEEVVAAAAAQPDLPDNVSFASGDVYALDHPDDSFDVVHAHQVLQHLSDPVRALVEMKRVCRPGGLVAVRDADYAAFAWAPGDPGLDRWLDIYRTVARGNHGEPDAGRHLERWAVEAGFSEVTAGVSIWRFTTDDERAWWGRLWADRMTMSAVAEQAEARGVATAAELAAVAAALLRWADAAAGWFVVPHGEVLARP